MSKKRLPSLGIQRGLKGLTSRWMRARLRNYMTGSLLDTLYTADPAGSGDAVVFRDPRRDSSGEDDGRPIPPLDLLMSWNDDVATWLATGREHAGTLRAVFSEHGVALGDGATLVDWGSNTGRVLRHFAPEAEAGAVAWGMDVDEVAMEWAKANLSPPFRFATITQLPRFPLPDASVDALYAISVMTHLDQLRDMWLLEIARILRPGGVAVLTIHDHATLEHIRDHDIKEPAPLIPKLDEALRHDVTVVRGGDWGYTFVYFSHDHVRRDWGRYLEVVDIRPMAIGFQAAVVLRRPG